MLNEKTIVNLTKQYKRASEYLDEYFEQNIQIRQEFFENFHTRPTNSYIRIVCINESYRFAMRTLEAKSKDDFFDGIDKAFCLINDVNEIESLPKQQVLERYGFNVYECGKRNKQTEYVIQAKFAKHLKAQGYSLLATEFNIKSGGRQRVDVVALKDNEMWLVEIKDGDIRTDASEQVNEYKRLISQNKDTCWNLLRYVENTLSKDFVVKTAVVYTKGEKQRLNIDKLWKYENEMFCEQ